MRPPFDSAGSVALILAAALAGAATRWALLEVLPTAQPLAWPLVAVNAAGCALIGWAVVRIEAEPHLAAVTYGFCGALTSASSFALEVARRLDGGAVGAGAAHVALTLAATGAAFVAGRRVALR